MIYKLLISLGFAVVATSSVAQAQPQITKRSAWYLTGAAGYTQNSEQNISKLVNKGFGIAGTVGYEFGEDAIHHEVKARVGIALAKTSYEKQYRSLVPDIMLQYSLLKSVESGESNWRYGGFFRAQIQDSYYPRLDQGRYYWANFYGLGIRGDYSRPIGTGLGLNIGLELPVVGLVSRPETERYFRIDELTFGNLIKENFSNLSAGSLNRILNPTLTAAIVRDSWLHQFGYEANYLSISNPSANDFKRVDHRLFIKVKL